MNINTKLSKFTKNLPSPLSTLAIASDSQLRENALIEESAAALFSKVSTMIIESISSARKDSSKTLDAKGQAVLIELPLEVVSSSLPAGKGLDEEAVVKLAMKNLQTGLSKKGYSSQYLNLATYDEVVSGHLLVIGLRQGQELSGITQELIRGRVTNAA